MRTFLLHTKDGNRVITASEIVQNAKDQEAAGIEPGYYWYNHKTKEAEKERPAGWLIWSTWEDGACICYKRNDNTYGILTGWQSDFCLA